MGSFKQERSGLKGEKGEKLLMDSSSPQKMLKLYEQFCGMFPGAIISWSILGI
jgi:hypothetical protein